MTEVIIDTVCRPPGTRRQTRPFIMGSETMPQIIVQNMWPPRASSECLEGLRLLRPNQSPVFPRWQCRRVEGKIPRSRRRREGNKDRPGHRPAGDTWCESLVVLFIRVPCANALCIAVLQGGSNMENPPTPQYPTIDWSNDVRRSFCDDLRLDGGWEHQRVFEVAPRRKPF